MNIVLVMVTPIALGLQSPTSTGAITPVIFIDTVVDVRVVGEQRCKRPENAMLATTSIFDPLY